MTSPWSPLDTLRHTVLRADDLLSQASDLLAMDEGIVEDHPVHGMLDAARKRLADGLGEQVDGVSWDLFIRIEKAALRSVYRYDDGSPVCVGIDDLGYRWQVFPRIEPDLLDPDKRRALAGKADLQLVPDHEGEDG